MIKKKLLASLLALCCVLAAALCGCAQPPEQDPTQTSEPESTQAEDPEPSTVTELEDGTRTIGAFIGGEPMQSVPNMPAGFFGEVSECNDSCFMATYNATNKDDYENYAALLEHEGYTRAADSGPDGIHQDVYYAAFQKEGTTIHLVHQALQSKTYVIMGDKENLSPYLLPDNPSVSTGRDDFKDTLTLVDPINGQALCMIFQMRNGHFICIDSGYYGAGDLILRMLQEMAPEGEKPVVEAWFLTHGHGDHFGGLQDFSNDRDMCDAIAVNGIYFNKPREEHVLKTTNALQKAGHILVDYLCTLMMKDENGQNTKLYRPVMGQRYYFGDATVEITNSTEFVPFANCTSDYNETSTTFIINVCGQKIQVMGDAETGCQHNMKNSFRSDYFSLDIYQVSHHGYNTLTEIVDYMACIKTAIFPNRFLVDAVCEEGATPYLIEHCSEYYYQGKDRGSLRMTFPYEVGHMEILGNQYPNYKSWQDTITKSIHRLYIEG